MKNDLKENAEKFAVWRVGNMNDWEYSYDEIAELTGVPLIRVKRICAANGWRCTSIEDQFQSVDSFMVPGNGIDASAFHV